MFAYDFMRNAFAAATIVAIASAAVGYFLVLRAQTFAGHALAHVGFAGATGAVLIGVSPIWGMTVMTLAAGIGMGFLGERIAQRDVAIGLVLAMSLALGLLFLHFFTSFATQMAAILFGNLLAVSRGEIGSLLALGLLCVMLLATISRPLLFVTLHPELAEARGAPARLYAILFLAIVALATAEAAQIVGVLLVFALMVAPPAAALRLSKSIGAGVALSIAFGLLECWLGIALAYRTDWPTSFCIVFLSGAIYALAALGARAKRIGAPSRIAVDPS